MTQIGIDLFPDNKPIKIEKYQQILGKKRVVMALLRRDNIRAKVYEDKGDRYELVHSFQSAYGEHWRLLIAQGDNTVFEHSGISRKFFYVFDKNDTEELLAENQQFDPEYFLSEFSLYLICLLLTRHFVVTNLLNECRPVCLQLAKRRTTL